MDENIIQQYMQGDSRQRAISHLKTLDLLDKRIVDLEEERKKGVVLREALEQIANPIKYLEEQAELQGASLNRDSWLLSENANWLKSKAINALGQEGK